MTGSERIPRQLGQDQNPPAVPADQTLPTQEPGTRPPVP